MYVKKNRRWHAQNQQCCSIKLILPHYPINPILIYCYVREIIGRGTIILYSSPRCYTNDNQMPWSIFLCQGSTWITLKYTNPWWTRQNQSHWIQVKVINFSADSINPSMHTRWIGKLYATNTILGCQMDELTQAFNERLFEDVLYIDIHENSVEIARLFIWRNGSG